MPQHLPQNQKLEWLRLLLAIVIVVVALTFGAVGRLDELVAVDLILLALFVLISPGMNKALRIWGLEARLEGTLTRAENTLQELRLLALAVSEPAVSFLTPIQLTERFSIGYRVSAARRIHEMLREIGIEEHDVENIFKEFKSRILWRIKAGAVDSIIAHIGATSDLSNLEKKKALISSSIEELVQYAERTKVSEEEDFLNWIEDARIFEADLVLRRPELLGVG